MTWKLLDERQGLHPLRHSFVLTFKSLWPSSRGGLMELWVQRSRGGTKIINRGVPWKLSRALDSGAPRVPLDRLGAASGLSRGSRGAASEMGSTGAAPALLLSFPVAGRFLLLAQDDFHTFRSDSDFLWLLDVFCGAYFLVIVLSACWTWRRDCYSHLLREDFPDPPLV